MLFHILKHPIAANVVLVTTSDTEKSSMVTDHSPTKLGNVIFKVYEVFRLLVSCYIVKMNVFIAPFEVVDDSFICEFLFHNKNILKEVYNPLLNVEMIKFRDHRLLVFKVSLVLIN